MHLQKRNKAKLQRFLINIIKFDPTNHDSISHNFLAANCVSRVRYHCLYLKSTYSITIEYSDISKQASKSLILKLAVNIEFYCPL